MTKVQRNEIKAEAAAKARREGERESRLFVAAFKGDKAEYLRACEEVEAERMAEVAL